MIGTYNDNGNAESCTPCAIGTYSDTANAESCTECPLGSSTFQDGSDHSSQCSSKKKYICLFQFTCYDWSVDLVISNFSGYINFIHAINVVGLIFISLKLGMNSLLLLFININNNICLN